MNDLITKAYIFLILVILIPAAIGASVVYGLLYFILKSLKLLTAYFEAIVAVTED